MKTNKIIRSAHDREWQLQEAKNSIAHGLVVVTRNVRDIERCSVRVYNPWAA